MRIVDSHFHWWPRSIFEELCRRSAGYPRAERNDRGGYNVWTGEKGGRSGAWAEWFDLDKLLAHENAQGYETDVVCSIGPFTAHFSEVSAPHRLHDAQMWNDE